MTQIDINNFNNFNPRMWYRIRNTHLPSTHTLDVINDAREASTGLLNLAPEAHYSGQYWQITSIGAGLYSLRTLWLGPHRVLDVRDEDGKPVLLHRSERREQCWRIRPWGDGSWAIVNAQSGEERCVDLVVQEGSSRVPVVMRLVDGESATQRWYITAAWPIEDEQD